MDNFKIDSDIDINTSINSLMPSGVILFIGGLSYATVNNQSWIDNNGLIPCDGRAVSRTTYSNLWSALGTTSSPWGQGDNSTTFNVPNFYSTRRFMTMPPVGTNISNTLSATSHTHSTTAIANANGSLTTGSYDHSNHTGNIVGASGGGHSYGWGSGNANFSGPSANGLAKPGNTSPVAHANHTHAAMSYPGFTSNSGGAHGHSLGFGTGASSGTSHNHTFSTSINTINGIIIEPQFVNALCFIKI